MNFLIKDNEFENIFDNNPGPSNINEQKNLLLSADVVATKPPKDPERFSFGYIFFK